MFDFHAELNQRLKQNTDILKTGMEVGLRECEDTKKALRAIIAAHDLNPDKLIPTPLLAAIEAARKHI